MGREKALAALQEYERVCEPGFHPAWAVEAILGVLFDLPEALIDGSSVRFRSDEFVYVKIDGIIPLFDIHLVDDIPFVVGRGEGGEVPACCRPHSMRFGSSAGTV